MANKVLSSLYGAGALLLAPLGALWAASASASDATQIKLVAHVPVSCSIEVLGAITSGKQVRMRFNRECNTAHSVVISGVPSPELGQVVLRLENEEADVSGGQGKIYQNEGYYQGETELVFYSEKGTEEDLVRYTDTLIVTVHSEF
jgi:hypothetical protein